MTTHPKHLSGFTLLEVLVAISITAFIGAASYWVLSEVIRSQGALDEHQNKLAKLQKVFYVLKQDIEQVVKRPIRDEYGERQFAFSADSGQQVEWTRQGWLNPIQQKRSELQRVQYSLEDNQFVRKYWFHLDRAQDAKATKQVLLPQIDELSIRYLKEDNNWTDSWPPSSAVSSMSSPTYDNLPLAIEITMSDPSFGKIIRLFMVSEKTF